MHKTTHIGLIRHGLTTWNSDKRIQGQADIPLSTRGKEMVDCWGKKLLPYEWDLLVTSPLARAGETGCILARNLQLPQDTVQGLQEQDWGGWTGCTIRELRRTQREKLQQAEDLGWSFQPPRGESRKQVLQRAAGALHRLALRHPGKRILAVSHQGVIKCLLYHLLHREFLPSEPNIILPYCLHLLEVDSKELSLKRMNALALEQ